MTVSALQLARIPDLLSSTLTSSQINSTQQQLAQVEQQLSTGQLWSQPSDDPSNSAITMQLQRTLTQQTTYSTNLASAQSQLGQVDNSLSNVTTLIQQAQNIASADVNSTVSSSQRQADAQVVNSIYSQILNIANTQSGGLYLFGGDKNTSAPYVAASGGVQFVGSSTVLNTTVDANTNVAFMVNGASIFGGTANGAQNAVDLTPSLVASTRISDLRGATGKGVQLGAIQISNGATSTIVDLSNASNIGDVVNAIDNAGVGGITAAISGEGITLSGGAGDNITVSDVGGDSTADELGINRATGAGAGASLVGASTEPNVTEFTLLSALRNGAGVDPAGITVTNGVNTAHISFAGLNTVGDVLNAINGSGTSVDATVNPDGTGITIANPVQGSPMTISENGGTSAAELGVQTFNAQTPLADLNGGKGVAIAASGNDFTIGTANGSTINVSLAGATTVQDVINKINAASGGAVVASFSTTANGISLHDTTAGASTFAVTGVNGSTSASDLGLTTAAVGSTITGTDVNPISPTGVFANLTQLQNALQTGDQAAMTAAAGGLQNDYNAAVDARGVAGAQVQEMQNRQDQITTQNTATQSLMSQLSDTDFTAAITKFQTLQTSLQATLETAAKTLNLSLLDFLG
ncbi:MAG TPA: flagellar hook-associated protein FlgL [Tepidisphaeraceae bacterium]|jgi:flagellar hook-associated protein 3|nr:flagellar hook-associated protein FlgL [Tepidisphaeraceae bacterium]